MSGSGNILPWFDRGVRASALLLLAALVMAPPLAGQGAQATAPTAAVDTVTAGRYDNGKMWTFEYPPIEYLRQTYDFSPDTAWFRRARLGALRIPGCSASLVSARGLVVTNHHCGREGATEVSRPGENILDNGFYARNERDERRAESMYADQLIAIVDVTASIDSATSRATNPGQAEAARDSAGEAITQRLTAQYGERDIEVEVISLWNGARTSAYVFHRYHDVRLVMTPELQIGYFGGDADNFTYPRYALDFTFFRLYGEDGRPLSTPDYFRWSTEGVESGDLIFVVGNPGSTSRLQTVAQLEFRRDAQDAAILHVLSDRAAVYREYLDAHPDAPEELTNTLFEFLNGEKAYAGIVRGLKNEYLMARRRADQRNFQAAITARPELQQRYGDLIERMATIQERKAQYSKEVRAFIALGHPTLNASVFLRALYAAQYVGAKGGGAPASALEGLKQAILGVRQQPGELQEELFAARLRDVVEIFGPTSDMTRNILGGRSPEVAAALAVSSPLADSARTAALLAADSLSGSDPAVQMVRAMLVAASPFQSQFGQLSQQEEDIALQLGRARFEVFGVAVPPDATFSPRIADGVVGGYDYNGTVAPAFTTLYGLFDRHFSHGGGEWSLPARWLDRLNALDLETPVDFVATADITGGNSGSPVLDRELRIVGLAFDGNIESLPGNFIYTDESSRMVAVDTRGVLEALRAVYRADRIVRELLQAAAVPVR